MAKTEEPPSKVFSKMPLPTTKEPKPNPCASTAIANIRFETTEILMAKAAPSEGVNMGVSNLHTALLLLSVDVIHCTLSPVPPISWLRFGALWLTFCPLADSKSDTSCVVSLHVQPLGWNKVSSPCNRKGDPV
eukprot:6470487-Amphidinium_carterae.1